MTGEQVLSSLRRRFPDAVTAYVASETPLADMRASRKYRQVESQGLIAIHNRGNEHCVEEDAKRCSDLIEFGAILPSGERHTLITILSVPYGRSLPVVTVASFEHSIPPGTRITAEEFMTEKYGSPDEESPEIASHREAQKNTFIKYAASLKGNARIRAQYRVNDVWRLEESRYGDYAISYGVIAGPTYRILFMLDEKITDRWEEMFEEAYADRRRQMYELTPRAKYAF